MVYPNLIGSVGIMGLCISGACTTGSASLYLILSIAILCVWGCAVEGQVLGSSSLSGAYMGTCTLRAWCIYWSVTYTAIPLYYYPLLKSELMSVSHHTQQQQVRGNGIIPGVLRIRPLAYGHYVSRVSTTRA